jgi:hypothetical protein
MPADLKLLLPFDQPTTKPEDETPLDRLRRIHQELVDEGTHARPELTIVLGGGDDA